MKKNRQTINCFVKGCKYCNCIDNCCMLNKIKICNCSKEENKDATMCNNYNKK